MDESKSLESLFRVWGDYNAYLEVFEDGDGMIRIKTRNEESEIYFGKVDCSFEPAVAALLAEAFTKLTNKQR